MKKMALFWGACCLFAITGTVLWIHNSYSASFVLRPHVKSVSTVFTNHDNDSSKNVSTVFTNTEYGRSKNVSTENNSYLYPRNICGQKNNSSSYNTSRNIEREEHGTYILTAKYGGQQGAAIRGLLSQQCFSHHLPVPVSIVEPLLINSILGHVNYQPHQRDLITFSDLFNIHTFNAVSRRSGYRQLATWAEFLSNAKEKTILVELQTGKRKHTSIEWKADITAGTLCYSGKKYSAFNDLVTCSVCIVRIVTICCVESEESSYKSALTMNELKNAMFGSWMPEEVNLLFIHWTSYWHVPSEPCKAPFYSSGHFHSSDQLVKHANDYRDLYLKSNQSTIAFVLRFEYLVILHYDIDACIKKVYETHKTIDKSVFVAADVGKYGSGTWKRYLSQFSSKKASQVMKTFKNAVSLLVGDHWTFEDWEDSFSTVTAGIDSNGYIAALQKTIASQADCIYFLHVGNFQSSVKEEYVRHHPQQSEQCIHFICS